MMVERVLVLHCFFRLSANTQRDLLCHAENLSNSLFARKSQVEKERPGNRSLAESAQTPKTYHR
jgi:hypothetical protein